MIFLACLTPTFRRRRCDALLCSAKKSGSISFKRKRIAASRNGDDFRQSPCQPWLIWSAVDSSRPAKVRCRRRTKRHDGLEKREKECLTLFKRPEHRQTKSDFAPWHVVPRCDRKTKSEGKWRSVERKIWERKAWTGSEKAAETPKGGARGKHPKRRVGHLALFSLRLLVLVTCLTDWPVYKNLCGYHFVL